LERVIDWKSIRANINESKADRSKQNSIWTSASRTIYIFSWKTNKQTLLTQRWHGVCCQNYNCSSENTLLWEKTTTTFYGMLYKSCVLFLKKKKRKKKKV
jgi:hypothetical protein